MNVTLSAEIQANPILLMLVASANSIFESELGPTTHDVHATWTLKTDEHLRPHLELHMKNGDVCKGRFHVQDLHDMNHIRERFRDWCGDLIRSHRKGGQAN